MVFQIDVQMTVKHGSILMGEVIDSILYQEEDGLEVHLYVDASADFALTPHEDLVEQLTRSEHQKERFEIDVKAANKRNKMLRLGSSPYVYFADPDVLLPNERVFLPMARGLERHPKLGAVGIRCHHGNHVSMASMMLRRIDLYRIGRIRTRQGSCACSGIAEKLAESGKFVIPLRGVRATHLDQEYKELEDDKPKWNTESHDRFRLRSRDKRLDIRQPKPFQRKPILTTHRLDKQAVREFMAGRRREARGNGQTEKEAEVSSKRFTIRMPKEDKPDNASIRGRG